MDASRIRIRGPLASHVEGLWATLAGQGYTALSIANLARVMAHLSGWLSARALTPADLTTDHIRPFLRARKRAGYTCWRRPYRPADSLLAYLNSL